MLAAALERWASTPLRLDTCLLCPTPSDDVVLAMRTLSSAPTQMSALAERHACCRADTATVLARQHTVGQAEASALALIWSNSCWLIAPESRRDLAEAI